MKQVWQIDPEFRLLSVPLSLEEENRLENTTRKASSAFR